jgi:mono/diheme cytochrome c family protein
MTDIRSAARWSLVPGVLLFGTALAFHRPAQAVPAFAQQTGRNCAACHVGGFGPQLTPFGREFKLGG